MFSATHSSASLAIVGTDGDLFVCLVVHEDDLVLGGVEQLQAPRLSVHACELLSRAKRPVEDRSARDVPHLGAHESAALARFDVLELHDVNGWPSISMAMPVLNWLVETTSAMVSYLGVT